MLRVKAIKPTANPANEKMREAIKTPFTEHISTHLVREVFLGLFTKGVCEDQSKGALTYEN